MTFLINSALHFLTEPDCWMQLCIRGEKNYCGNMCTFNIWSFSACQRAKLLPIPVQSWCDVCTYVRWLHAWFQQILLHVRFDLSVVQPSLHNIWRAFIRGTSRSHKVRKSLVGQCLNKPNFVSALEINRSFHTHRSLITCQVLQLSQHYWWCDSLFYRSQSLNSITEMRMGVSIVGVDY